MLNMTTLTFLGCTSSYQYHACKHNKNPSPHRYSPSIFCSSSCLTYAFGLFLQSSSDDCDPHEGIHEGKEGKYRLQVTQFVQRLEYWQKELTNTLVTSITVVPVHGRTVAYLGTADGRNIQVKKSHCSIPFLTTTIFKRMART